MTRCDGEVYGAGAAAAALRTYVQGGEALYEQVRDPSSQLPLEALHTLHHFPVLLILFNNHFWTKEPKLLLIVRSKE